MSNIFGVEHEHSTVPLPHGGVQHTFHLNNGVVISAVQAPRIAASGTPEIDGSWEVYAWREATNDNDVFLTGSDTDGVIAGLTTDRVGEILREAAALPKVGA
jgi:hypothetical protein